MDLGVLVTLSCVLTSVSMLVIIGFLFFLARTGGQGITSFVDNILGRGGDNAEEETPQRQRASARSDSERVANSQSLRQRARNLDFPAPNQAQAASLSTGTVIGMDGIQAQSAQSSRQNNAGPSYPEFPPMQQPSFNAQSGFGNQSQQPSLRPSNSSNNSGGQYPAFNPQAQQGNSGAFQPSMPSLSPSRPFQQGTAFNTNARPANPGQNQFGNQQAPQFGQQNQFNNQQPQQNPNQFGNQQRGFNAQQAPSQNNSLGQNRPPLQSRPRPSDTYVPSGSVGHARDRRRGDDYDRIYDDGGDNGNNFIDEVGDFIDNF